MTLLSLFLGGNPTAAVPPEPAPTVTAVAYEEAFEATAPEDPFGLPLVTSTARHSSPSLMVAAPPEGYGAPFDVFSPAVRPPHEFPTLFPCESVTLVPCPPPLPAYEAPAIRHVSFLDEGTRLQVAECESAYKDPDQPGCPPGAVFTHRVFGHALPALGLWDQLHARQHAAEHHHHAAMACEPGQACPLAGAPVICPLGFGSPLSAPAFVVAAQSENHPGCPVNLPGHPFPGAKNVHHIVSATYEIPHETAKSLAHLLETGNGVQTCSINGDELTVNATPPAQMAIAQFLAHVVLEPKSASQPARTISVHHTETKPCTTECTEAKPCTTECSAAKCCTECGEKCECCKCGKTKPAGSEPTAHESLDKRLFSFYVGLQNCNACPPAAAQPISVQVQAAPAKPVLVKIQATPDGVLLHTSDGTQVHADSIQLETQGINKLQVEHAQSVQLQPKPTPKPATAKTPKYPVSY
jgi:hypothetical protein